MGRQDLQIVGSPVPTPVNGYLVYWIPSGTIATSFLRLTSNLVECETIPQLILLVYSFRLSPRQGHNTLVLLQDAWRRIVFG